MPRTRIGLVLDCHDLDRLSGFWAQALSYEQVTATSSYAVLLPGAGSSGPKLLLQKVPEPKTVKNRMHLDIDADDIEAEVARLELLGATRHGLPPVREHGMSWVVLSDPEGNEFCVCDGGGPVVRRVLPVVARAKSLAGRLRRSTA